MSIMVFLGYSRSSIINLNLKKTNSDLSAQEVMSWGRAWSSGEESPRAQEEA